MKEEFNKDMENFRKKIQEGGARWWIAGISTPQ
jgi:hypothetical protein